MFHVSALCTSGEITQAVKPLRPQMMDLRF